MSQLSAARQGFEGSSAPGARLVAAASAEDASALAALIDEEGLNVNAVDPRSGRNALHEACVHSNAKCVKVLFARGANAHTRTILGKEAPLHLAVQHDSDVIVRMLIKRGVKLDHYNKQGYTPLHLARSEAVAFILIESGADPWVKSRDGRIPLQMAKQNKYKGVADLLERITEEKSRIEWAIEKERKDERTKLYHANLAKSKKERAESKQRMLMYSYLKFRWR